MSDPLGTPAADIKIDSQLVYRLLKAQYSEVASLPICKVDAGWDNAMFRLGEQLAVRLPQRQAAASLIAHEQVWLPLLASKLPIAVPTPYRVGQPTQSYPWNWSVLPWIKGVAADQAQPDTEQAVRLAEFLRSLHTAAPTNAPFNPFRNAPLASKKEAIASRIQRLQTKTTLITPTILDLYNRAFDIPIDIEPTWIHGDLHPRNILIHKGKISGVIDWGDMTSGDAATDLAAVWMLFDKSADRKRAIAHYGTLSNATLQRAKGWAVFFAILFLDTGLIDNPRHVKIGKRILCHLGEDEAVKMKP